MLQDLVSEERNRVWTAEQFRELFERESPKVLGVLVRLLGSRPVAEKVLEEIFQEAWLHPERCLGKERSPLFFLLCLARERALAHLRTKPGLLPQAAPEPV